MPTVASFLVRVVQSRDKASGQRYTATWSVWSVSGVRLTPQVHCTAPTGVHRGDHTSRETHTSTAARRRRRRALMQYHTSSASNKMGIKIPSMATTALPPRSPREAGDGAEFTATNAGASGRFSAAARLSAPAGEDPGEVGAGVVATSGIGVRGMGSRPRSGAGWKASGVAASKACTRHAWSCMVCMCRYRRLHGYHASIWQDCISSLHACAGGQCT